MRVPRGCLALALVSAPVPACAANRPPVAAPTGASSGSKGSTPTLPADAPSPAAVPRAPQGTVLHAVGDALNGAGHECNVTSEQVICDEQKSNVATVVVVYAEEPTLGPYLGFVTSFMWKEPNGCSDASAKLVELNAKFDLLRSSCTSDRLIFALTAPISERGMTGGDVRAMASYFQSVVANVLGSSELVKAVR
jgi:hypothetical protein